MVVVYSDAESAECCALFRCDSCASIVVWDESTQRRPRLFHGASLAGLHRATVHRPARLPTTTWQV